MKYYPETAAQPFGENTVITQEASILPSVFGYNVPSETAKIVLEMVDDAKRLIDFERAGRRFGVDDEVDDDVNEDLDEIKHTLKTGVLKRLEMIERKYL